MTRAFLLVFLVLLGCASTKTWERPGFGGAVRPEMGSPQPGELAPDFVLPDLDGHAVALSSFRGSWVLLHFTATWCPFCDTEIAHLGEVADAFATRGVRTLIVDVEEQPAAWHAYASKHVAASLVALHDVNGDGARRFAPPRAQPSFDDRAQAVLDATLIIDPNGLIRLFLLPDSAHFDPKFGAVRAELDALTPRPVVDMHAAPTKLPAGGQGEISLAVTIAGGHHVMSDHPSEPEYIATHVELEPADGLASSEARYPPPRAFSLGDRSIATFEGTLDVRIPITAASNASLGAHRAMLRVRYQACTRTHCLFPATQMVPAMVTVD